MLTKRVIPCLDIDNGRVVKGIKFQELISVGDPVELARQYYEQGADELTLLDITASSGNRTTMLEVINRVSQQVFIPITVGGGIRTLDDMRKTLRAGADKLSFCSAALKDPSIISEGARIFGSQCIVISIDAKKTGTGYSCFSNGGRVDTRMDAIEWAKKSVELGAGEILLNSIDSDGTKDGYDLFLTQKISNLVSVPVIASGGAGAPNHMFNAIKYGKADAVLAASILHNGSYSISCIKDYLKTKGVIVR